MADSAAWQRASTGRHARGEWQRSTRRLITLKRTRAPRGIRCKPSSLHLLSPPPWRRRRRRPTRRGSRGRRRRCRQRCETLGTGWPRCQAALRLGVEGVGLERVRRRERGASGQSRCGVSQRASHLQRKLSAGVRMACAREMMPQLHPSELQQGLWAPNAPLHAHSSALVPAADCIPIPSRLPHTSALFSRRATH